AWPRPSRSSRSTRSSTPSPRAASRSRSGGRPSKPSRREGLSARPVGPEHGAVVDGAALAAEVDAEVGHGLGGDALRAGALAAEEDRRGSDGSGGDAPAVLGRDGLDEADDARLRRRVGGLLGHAPVGPLPAAPASAGRPRGSRGRAS